MSIFKDLLILIFYVYEICHICVFLMCMQCSQRQEEAFKPLELELQTAVNHETVIRKQTRLLQEQSQLLTIGPSFQTRESIIFINWCLLEEFQRTVI